jgi:hypothetical protein
MANKSSMDADDSVSPAECFAASGPFQNSSYGSGYTAVLHQLFSKQEPQQAPNHTVEQGVVLFPSAQAAIAFVNASSQSWSACANRSYTTTYAGMATDWRAGPVYTTNGRLTATKTRLGQGRNGWACQRALMASNNVVIDIEACSHSITYQAVNITRQIAAKVPTT